MNKKSLFYTLASVLLAFVVFVAPDAQAQIFSSKGVIQNSGQNGINRCQDGALRSQERALTIQQRINRVLRCNDQGQLYDPGSGACVSPTLSPEHIFADDNSGDTLTLVNPNGTNGTAVRVGGARGSNVTCMEDPVGCTFNGTSYDHGDRVVAYREDVVLGGRSCESSTNRETRTCNNGTFTGSFAFDSCNDTNDCTFDGQTLADGESVTAYLTDNPGAGQSCSSQTRTCNNGSLSGTYAFATCGDEDPCTFNGNTVPHGGSVTAYEVERVSAGGSCNSENRVCTNGSLSGSFQYESCETDLPTTPQPPTSQCFFYVSGLTPPYASVGWSGDSVGNHVGAGAYPDATVPFAKANSGTFDFIAIGPKTRLEIFKKKNFAGGTFIDIKGPAIIGNQCLPASSYPRGWKTDTNPTVSSGGAGGADINKLNVASTVYKDMFPTNKRIERVMNHTSVGCEDITPDPAAQDKKLLWGGGSVKVYCEQ